MNRDKELCKKLQGFGLLTTKQVSVLLFPGIALTTILRRLRKLEDAGYIKRVEGLLNNERAWALTADGANLVSAQTPKLYFRKDQLDHDLKLSGLRLALESIGVVHSWIPEHEIRAKVCAKNGTDKGRHMLIPDGIVGIEHKGFKESLALELELSFKNSKRYERTFSGYSRKSSLWGIWYVVANQTLGKSIAKVASRALRYNPKMKFYWSLADEVITNPLESKLNGFNATFMLRDLFARQLLKKPAHLHAHQVSTLDIENENSELDVTAENIDGIAIPVI